MENELKPCPFCGHERADIMTRLPFHNEPITYYVCCFGCGARTAALVEEELATQFWNRRCNDVT